jgi:hypothetical protein
MHLDSASGYIEKIYPALLTSCFPSIAPSFSSMAVFGITTKAVSEPALQKRTLITGAASSSPTDPVMPKITLILKRWGGG